MKSVTTFTLRVPATLLGDSNDADLVLNIVSETEMTADEHAEATDAVFAGLGMLLTTFAQEKSPDIVSPAPAEPDQGPARWPGILCDDTGAIVAVRLGSPADIAGIVPGDRILAINGIGYGPDTIGPGGKWSQTVDATAPGEPMYVDIERPGLLGGFAWKTLVRPLPAGPVS